MAPAATLTGERQHLDSQPLNEFEAERARIIARNRRKLEEMGVIEAAGKLTGMILPPCSKPKFSSSKKRPRALPKDSGCIASNSSPAQQCVSTPATSGPKPPAFDVTPNIQYTTPFTLASIGVTVWDLGELHHGSWQQNYWSSRGCKYHHAYPVGFVASKVVFNRTWRMTITAGEIGPVFTVSDESGRITFSGTSPTKPWTDVCLAQRTGQRISGPQYYGFSDVLLQRAIATMYTPHELHCAQFGTPLRSTPEQQTVTAAAASGPMQQHQQKQPAQALHKLSVAEQFAQDLECSVRGIGTTTAAVIATTTALGGKQHSSLAGFRGWLAADKVHVQQFRGFLLNSPEMPNGSRHLPSWRNRWVPLIIQQLTSTSS